MAQVAEGDIKLATRTVGRLRVDAGMIRAEAGPLEPRLVVPVTIEMNNRPRDQMLVVTHLVSHLHIGDHNNSTTQVGLPARLELIPGMYAHSVPEGSGRHQTELRFQMSPEAVHRLERARHESADQLFTLNMRSTAAVAWARETRGEMQPARGGSGETGPEDPFKLQLGMHTDFSFFWTVEIDPLRIQVEPSAWVANVLPGLGVDTMRLVEVLFPPKLPGSGNAAKAFDEALQAFNARRYDECISKCRGIVSAWNKSLGATKARPMGKAVASRQGWAKDDARIEWLNGLWKSLVDLGNAVHHPESRAGAPRLSPQDAKLHLTMTATMSEYLYALTR